MYLLLSNSPLFVILGSCVVVTLSVRHASTSISSKDGLGWLTTGKAVAVSPTLIFEGFLDKALVTRKRKGILKDDGG